jgi:hypothetical protein
VCVSICRGAQSHFFVIIKHNPLLYSARAYAATQEEQNIIYHRARSDGCIQLLACSISQTSDAHLKRIKLEAALAPPFQCNVAPHCVALRKNADRPSESGATPDPTMTIDTFIFQATRIKHVRLN